MPFFMLFLRDDIFLLVLYSFTHVEMLVKILLNGLFIQLIFCVGFCKVSEVGEIDFEQMRDLNLVHIVHSFKTTLIHLWFGRSGPMVVDNGAM